MYQSLKKTTSHFHLYIFAFDDLCYKILEEMSLANITLISLKTFETEELLNIKQSRSKAEYCWTCTSSTIEHVLTKFNEPSCTYIDADLFFYNSPEVLNNELSENKNILITEHRYSDIASFYDLKRAGRFCVQYITFSNDQVSKNVLDTWKRQCLDWCYARYENGKFGDQKYLDEWPEKYKNVHILKHTGGGVAPWNIRRYRIYNENGVCTGFEKKTKKKFKLIFYHFHYVRFLSENKVDLGWNYLGQNLIKTIYYPYVRELIETENMLSKLNENYTIQLYKPVMNTFKEIVKVVIKKVSHYNIIEIN